MTQFSRLSQQQVTSTGMRIVGSAAAALVAQAASIQLQPPPTSDILWAARFRGRPRLGGGSAVPAILQVIGESLHSEWDACPPVTRDTPFTRPTGRFHGISWDVIGQAGAWRGELVWRHAHPVLAGTPCTSHLVIDEQQQITTVTLATAADGGVAGVRGFAGAGQSRPVLVDHLRQAVALTPIGFDDTPRMLGDHDIAPFVRDVLLSETREWPVAVLAPLEVGGYLVPPEQLAAELFGLAPLYVVAHHSSTYRLTDEIGDRRLSAYWGALRVYRPDFSCADRSEDHWLLLHERVDDPVQRATLLGQLSQFILSNMPSVEGVAARRALLERQHVQTNRLAVAEQTASPAGTSKPPVTSGSPDAVVPDTTASAPGSTAALTPSLPASGVLLPTMVSESLGALPGVMQQLVGQLADLSGTIAHLVSANARLADEITRLRTATAIRATSSNALERRLDKIDALLRPPTAPTAAEESVGAGDDEEERESQLSLVDVVRHAADEYSESLLILESAEATAAESPYQDSDKLAAVLQAMAYVARRRQEGCLETGLRAAFQELGVDYRANIAKSTSERLRRQYRFIGPGGVVYECPEHIAIGVNPRHLLRIYFTSRVAMEPRFVIGHIGRHLEAKSTT